LAHLYSSKLNLVIDPGKFAALTGMKDDGRYLLVRPLRDHRPIVVDSERIGEGVALRYRFLGRHMKVPQVAEAGRTEIILTFGRLWLFNLETGEMVPCYHLELKLACDKRGRCMSTNRAKCLFTVRDNVEGERSIIVIPRDNIPALSGKTLSFDLDPESTLEQAQTFARVLAHMVAYVAVTDSNDVARKLQVVPK
jgi:hypothetical protein